MPAQTPAIETHPQRDLIINALINGESPKKIAKWIISPSISHVAIYRYRVSRIEPRLAEAQKTAKLLQRNAIETAGQKLPIDQDIINAVAKASLDADPLRERLNRKYARYDSAIPKALANEDFNAFATMDKAETMAMRFEAELTGRLQNAAPVTQVQIVIGANLAQMPENTTESQGLADLTAAAMTVDIAPVRE